MNTCIILHGPDSSTAARDGHNDNNHVCVGLRWSQRHLLMQLHACSGQGVMSILVCMSEVNRQGVRKFFGLWRLLEIWLCVAACRRGPGHSSKRLWSHWSDGTHWCSTLCGRPREEVRLLPDIHMTGGRANTHRTAARIMEIHFKMIPPWTMPIGSEAT